MWLTIRTGDDAGKSVEVGSGEFIIGRDDDCDLTLNDGKVSRRHARITKLPDGRWKVEDLGSANGSFVNRQAVQTHELSGNEQLQFGDTVIACSATDPRVEIGGTVIESHEERGKTRPPQTQSALYRYVAARSRRVTILSGVALGLVAIVAVLLVAGVFSGEDTSAKVERVISRATPSTVLIVAGGDDGTETGSGWVLDARQGLIVTNGHVVNAGAPVQVGVGNEVRPASVEAAAPCDDLALLRLRDTRGLKSMRLGTQSSLKLGETVVAIGFPGGATAEAKLTSTTGVVSVVSSRYQEATLDVPAYPNVIQTDAAINPGNSGGPLLDLDGRLVGVNSAGRTLSPEGRIIQGQNFAIGVDRARQVLKTLERGRSIGWAGLTFEYLTPEQLKSRDLGLGLLISGTFKGRGGARAKIKPDSLLTAVNGQPLSNSLSSYCDVAGRIREGQRAKLTLTPPGSRRSRDVSVRFG
jgi:S1-C subfamily serine protease